MKNLKIFKISFIIIILQLVMSLYFAWKTDTGAMFPTHWNMQGEVDEYSGKWFSILMPLSVNSVIILFMLFFPILSPGYKKNQESFDKILPSVSAIMMTLFLLIHLMTLTYPQIQSLNLKFDPLLLILGFLFILLGNIIPKIPNNFFIGIRTPWTLANDLVWTKTHRIGGYCFVIGGLLFMAKSIVFGLHSNRLQNAFSIIIVLLFCYPILYSFISFRRLKEI